MAIELMNRIWWREDLDASEKLVLLSLADRADDEGVCWYAVETICRKSSLSRRGVQKVLARLCARQLLRKVHRHDLSNYYVIPVDKFPDVNNRPRPAKERGSLQYLEDEPDLFVERGERGARRRSERGSDRGAPETARGAPGAPNSLSDSLIDTKPSAGAREETLPEMVVRCWNALAADHEALATFNGELSPSRISKIEARAGEWIGRSLATGLATVEDASAEHTVWRIAFEQIARSKLLTGQKIDWAPTLDWVLGPKNFNKIMEGNYGHGHDRIGSPTNDASGRSAVKAGQSALELVERARNRAGRAGAGGYQSRSASAHR